MALISAFLALCPIRACSLIRSLSCVSKSLVKTSTFVSSSALKLLTASRTSSMLALNKQTALSTAWLSVVPSLMPSPLSKPSTPRLKRLKLLRQQKLPSPSLLDAYAPYRALYFSFFPASSVMHCFLVLDLKNSCRADL